MAAASYAGSHCHPIRIDLDPGTTEYKDIGFGFGIRSCRFACLDRYIGSPVWVFTNESRFHKTRKNGMSLSITPEHFDDLWGPLIKHESNSETIALQTEGGLLCKVSEAQQYWGQYVREDETLMHWVPAQPGSNGFLVDQSECPTGFFPLPFDTNTTMLIGYDEQEPTSSSYNDPWRVASCFKPNLSCGLDVQGYQRTLKGSQLVYIGTSKRVWQPDTKATTFTVGYSSPSIGMARTLKDKPATTWKASLLHICARPGQDLEPFMDLRAGLAWSVCTRNARPIALRDALTLAYPKKAKEIESLLRSARRDDSKR